MYTCICYVYVYTYIYMYTYLYIYIYIYTYAGGARGHADGRAPKGPEQSLSGTVLGGLIATISAINTAQIVTLTY